MLKTSLFAFLLAVLLTLTAPVYAQYQCSVTPQDDIHIKAQQVEVYGASGTLAIKPDGSVSSNGKTLNLSSQAREKAKAYQANLRRDLPYIYNGVNDQIISFHVLLDSVLATKLSNSGKTRMRLQDLKQQLIFQLNRVITPTPEGLNFNHEMIKKVEVDSRTLVQQHLGAIVQESINEMGSQGLQGLLGGIDDLHTSLQKAWKAQAVQSAAFANEVCNRARTLEEQREDLIRSLP